jgi:hypothetical protein
VNLSGASDLKEGNINANKLNADLDGASAMNISGSARELHVEASGASDLKALIFLLIIVMHMPPVPAALILL